MSISVKFRAKISKIKRDDKYTAVTLTTGRYDKREEKWYNSLWFARFVGNAHKAIVGMNEKDVIVCEGMITREPWDKDGETQWPKDCRVLVFDFKPYVKEDSGQSNSSIDEVDDLPDEDDIPF